MKQRFACCRQEAIGKAGRATRKARLRPEPMSWLVLGILLCARLLVSISQADVPPVNQPAPPPLLMPDPEQSSERAYGEPFDPSLCKSGREGYVYWAARDQVFAFPLDPNKKVYARSRNPNRYQHEDIPPPPDPNQPEGCYANPLRGGSVPYMEAYSAILFHKIIGRRIQIVFGGPDSHTQFAIPDERHFRDDPNRLSERLFREAKDCQRRESGMIECQITTGRGVEYNTQVFKVESRLLFPDSQQRRDLYVVAEADIPSDLSLKTYGKALESSIDLYNSVRLQDSFRVFPGEVDRLIPYYAGMIRFITAAHVNHYDWTGGSTFGGKRKR